MSQHIGSRTISAIGGSVKRVGNYRVHTFPSELVTDGLVLNLDAGDPRSYPSSGTTWTDLSGNGNNGTLVNGPTYSNLEGGLIDFDASNSASVNVGSVSSVNSSYTVEVWLKSDAVVNYKNVCDMNYGTSQSNTGPRLEQNSSGSLIWIAGNAGDTSYQGINVIASGMGGGTIYHVVLTYNATLEQFKTYLDGSLVNTEDKTFSEDHVAFNAVTLGVGFTTSRYFDGKIYQFRIYNRALSAAEVAQNYDSTKVRYTSYTNTFTPICGGGEGKVEVLCVAGGGCGGGGDNGQGGGGGGGAGGLIYNSAFPVDSNSSVSLSIGQGGVTVGQYDNGDNTTFGSLTSIGGGAGNAGTFTAGPNSNEGGDGGSGGGGFRDGAVGGSGVTGQGNDGGNAGTGSSSVGGGGGGGAGAAGENGNGTIGGRGGSGLAYSISGKSKFYAAGGGAGGHNTIGSAGGSGIGGDGEDVNLGLNAVPNTGSGGGGGRGATGITRIGGNGSNGTVIVRYPATDYNVEVLVVGGGGGGGQDTGGGGGAGGLIYNSSYPVSSGKKLQVTVGKGGPAATGNSLNATSGNNSVFSNQVAFGGGYGSSNTSLSPGGNGGSGGGGGAYSGYQGVGGTGVSGQGNNGGDAAISAGGGGGGAGQSGFGGDGTTNGDSASDGGDGLTYSITGSSVVYAAGGGGGQNTSDNRGTGGSSGVGGDGGTSTRNPTDPDVNTGSGGGGGASTNQPNGVRRGTSGADGIVIIAYKGPQRGIGGTIDTTSRPGYTLHKFTTTGTDFFIP